MFETSLIEFGPVHLLLGGVAIGYLLDRFILSLRIASNARLLGVPFSPPPGGGRLPHFRPLAKQKAVGYASVKKTKAGKKKTSVAVSPASSSRSGYIRSVATRRKMARSQRERWARWRDQRRGTKGTLLAARA